MILPAPDLAVLTAETFNRLHGTPATLLAYAPGRVNVVGEHTDYLGGRCLPLALPYAAWVAAAPRSDDLVRISSGQGQAVDAGRDAPGVEWHGSTGVLDPTRPLEPGWQAYVLGALRAVGWTGGVDLHVESTVPVGSGLSSSAALICATATAVTAAPPASLLDACVAAEQLHVGAPTGGMDQAAALLSSAGHVLELDFGSPSPPSTRPVRWAPEEAGLELLVVDTGIRHDNSDGAFAARRAEAEAALALPPSALGAASPALRRRRRHVESENARVGAVARAAEFGDWRRVGMLLTESHVSLRDDHEVSCAELDLVVDAALDAGAWGARMTGGGFGGCAIVLTPGARRAAVISTVVERARAAGAPSPTFLLAPPSGPARRLVPGGPGGEAPQVT